MQHSHPSTDIPQQERLVIYYSALAVAIHIIEASLPSPVPGIKPGLANIIVLVAGLRHGWRMAISISLLRVLASSLLLGTFLTPTFLLSLAGSLFSLPILALADKLYGHAFSAIGLSILAALCHTSGQFGVAYWLFIPHPGLWLILPWLLTAALAFGIVSGTITNRIMALLPPVKA